MDCSAPIPSDVAIPNIVANKAKTSTTWPCHPHIFSLKKGKKTDLTDKGNFLL